MLGHRWYPESYWRTIAEGVGGSSHCQRRYWANWAETTIRLQISDFGEVHSTDCSAYYTTVCTEMSDWFPKMKHEAKHINSPYNQCTLSLGQNNARLQYVSCHFKYTYRSGFERRHQGWGLGAWRRQPFAALDAPARIASADWCPSESPDAPSRWSTYNGPSNKRITLHCWSTCTHN
jgi:hypothetical protein